MDKAIEIRLLTLLMLSAALLNGCVSDRQTIPPTSTTINEPPSATPATAETPSTEKIATPTTLPEAAVRWETTTKEAAVIPSTAEVAATTPTAVALPDPNAVLLNLNGEKWTYYGGYGFRINRMIYDADYVIQGVMLDVKNPQENLEDNLQVATLTNGLREGINVKFLPGHAKGEPLQAELFFWGKPATSSAAKEATIPGGM